MILESLTRAFDLVLTFRNLWLNKNYNKKIVNISELEFNSHKEFVKKELKKNFY